LRAAIGVPRGGISLDAQPEVLEELVAGRGTSKYRSTQWNLCAAYIDPQSTC
jgi:hypothetical protein